MAISATNLSTSGDATDSASYTTASITPPSNNLILIWVEAIRTVGTIPEYAVVSGCSLTWVEVARRQHSTTGRGMTLLRALGASPTTGTLSITFDEAMSGAIWSIAAFSGVDTGGTNGSGAVVQSAVNSQGGVTSLGVTLAAFGNANNGTAAAFFHVANEATTVGGGGYTQIGTHNQGSPNKAILSEYLTTNDTTPDASWTTSAIGMGIGVEIKAAAGGPTAHNLSLLGVGQ